MNRENFLFHGQTCIKFNWISKITLTRKNQLLETLDKVAQSGRLQLPFHVLLCLFVLHRRLKKWRECLEKVSPVFLQRRGANKKVGPASCESMFYSVWHRLLGSGTRTWSEAAWCDDWIYLLIFCFRTVGGQVSVGNMPLKMSSELQSPGTLLVCSEACTCTTNTG